MAKKEAKRAGPCKIYIVAPYLKQSTAALTDMILDGGYVVSEDIDEAKEHTTDTCNCIYEITLTKSYSVTKKLECTLKEVK